jgi:hypothetical protein
MLTEHELPSFLTWCRTSGRMAELDRLLRSSLPSLLRRDPSLILSLAGMAPDPWQARALRSPSRRVLFLCSRGAGKSQTASALALREALLQPPALVLLLSHGIRQSGELFRERLLPLWRGLGCPSRRRAPTKLELSLANGSRIVSLPANEAGIRGYHKVRLLVIDEAARVPDEMYFAVRPMIAVGGGSLVVLSTAFGRRGWFYEAWEGGTSWERYKVQAQECPRLDRQAVAEDLLTMGERRWNQEYLCHFNDAAGQLIPQAVIDRAMAMGG